MMGAGDFFSGSLMIQSVWLFFEKHLVEVIHFFGKDLRDEHIF